MEGGGKGVSCLIKLRKGRRGDDVGMVTLIVLFFSPRCTGGLGTKMG